MTGFTLIKIKELPHIQTRICMGSLEVKHTRDVTHCLHLGSLIARFIIRLGTDGAWCGFLLIINVNELLTLADIVWLYGLLLMCSIEDKLWIIRCL